MKKIMKESSEKKNAESKSQENLPGYPHYPPSEDILNHTDEIERVEVTDMDAFNKSQKPIEKDKNLSSANEETSSPDENDTDETVSGGEAGISKEELELLGSDNLHSDDGDDEQLKNRSHPIDMTAEDLDVPGAELDDTDEKIGEEDEENNSYSIGGDRHDDL